MPFLPRLTATLAAAAVAVTVAAAPAQAALGPAQTVDIQLTSYAGGYQTQVGRVVGTIQFDDGRQAYNVTLTVCRQSSYTINNVRLFVNGALSQSFSVQDSTLRPQACGGGHGLSGVYAQTLTYGYAVQKVAIGVEGIHFDGSTARTVGSGAAYTNPYF